MKKETKRLFALILIGLAIMALPGCHATYQIAGEKQYKVQQRYKRGSSTFVRLEGIKAPYAFQIDAGNEIKVGDTIRVNFQPRKIY